MSRALPRPDADTGATVHIPAAAATARTTARTIADATRTHAWESPR